MVQNEKASLFRRGKGDTVPMRGRDKITEPIREDKVSELQTTVHSLCLTCPIPYGTVVTPAFRAALCFGLRHNQGVPEGRCQG